MRPAKHLNAGDFNRHPALVLYGKKEVKPVGQHNDNKPTSNAVITLIFTILFFSTPFWVIDNRLKPRQIPTPTPTPIITVTPVGDTP